MELFAAALTVLVFGLAFLFYLQTRVVQRYLVDCWNNYVQALKELSLSCSCPACTGEEGDGAEED